MSKEHALECYDDLLEQRGWKRREYQRETVEKIMDYFDDGKRLVMANCPTGFGKTLVGWSVASGFGDAFYVTGNLSLQEQIIVDELPFVRNISGRDNYDCSAMPATCGQGYCTRHKGYSCNRNCMYKLAKEEALDSPIALTNLFYFILEGGRSFSGRELLIIDEAHNLSEILVNFTRSVISGRTSNNYIATKALESYYELQDVPVLYVESLIEEIDTRLEELDEKEDLNDKELAEKRKLSVLRVKLATCISAKPFITVEESYRGDYKWIVVQHLKPDHIVEDLVFNRAGNILLMSATINPFLISEELDLKKNIGQKQSVYFTVPSTFDASRRPLYLMPVVNFKYANQTLENQILVGDVINKIVDTHKEEKGIIFCQGYRYTDMLHAVNPRLTFHDSEDRRKVVSKWLSDFSDKVLVGVKMEEGLDLKGDAARFSICFKAPFANSFDKRVARRLELKHWNWYFNVAQQTLLQAYGRLMRSEDDYGAMYVLDEGACKLLKRRGVPTHVKEAIIEVDYKEFMERGKEALIENEEMVERKLRGKQTK